MPISARYPDYLVHVARTTAPERQAVFDLAKLVDPRLRAAHEHALLDVAMDRLQVAEDCLRAAIAAGLGRGFGEARLRLAANRGYYSCHQSVRALLLLHLRVDVDGHTRCIDEFKRFLADSANLRAAGLPDDSIHAKLVEAKQNRNIADYSPYPRMREGTSILRISGDDWLAAASHNAKTAQECLQCAWRFVGSHPIAA